MKPSAKCQASAPVSRPEIQPPPPRFSSRQPSMVGTFPSRHGSINKAFECRRNPAAAATEDVPRLLGRERSLAIPWHLLEADKKRKRCKRELSKLTSCSGAATLESQVDTSSTELTKHDPVFDSKDLPRLLGRTYSLAEESVEHSRKCPGAPSNAPTSTTECPCLVPELGAPECEKKKTISKKNLINVEATQFSKTLSLSTSSPLPQLIPKNSDQRCRKKPCYQSSCEGGNSASQLGKRANSY